MQHELEEVYSGFPKSAQRPTFGSVVSRFRRADGALPPYVSLEYSNGITPYENPQYVGAAHAPLHIAGGDGVRNLSLVNGMSNVRMDDRRGLLRAFDHGRLELDACRESMNLDAFTQRAFDIVSSTKASDAFDLSRESDETKARYGQRGRRGLGQPEVSTRSSTGGSRRSGRHHAHGHLGSSWQRHSAGWWQEHLAQPEERAASAGPFNSHTDY
jgi:hypothetical protein